MPENAQDAKAEPANMIVDPSRSSLRSVMARRGQDAKTTLTSTAGPDIDQFM